MLFTAFDKQSYPLLSFNLISVLSTSRISFSFFCFFFFFKTKFIFYNLKLNKIGRFFSPFDRQPYPLLSLHLISVLSTSRIALSFLFFSFFAVVWFIILISRIPIISCNVTDQNLWWESNPRPSR